MIETCLESEEAFNTYLTNNPTHVRRAYLAFRALVRLFSKSVDDREKLEKKVNNLEHEKSCMEGALTYVEEQLNALRAAPLPSLMPFPPAPAPVAPMATHPIRYLTLLVQSPVPATPLVPTSVAPGPTHVATLAPASTTPSEYDVPSASDRSHVATRVIKILDPDQFYADKAKDKITYEDWHL